MDTKNLSSNVVNLEQSVRLQYEVLLHRLGNILGPFVNTVFH